MSKRDMIVAGVMSGTSADGINVALVRIGTSPRVCAVRQRLRHTIDLLGHAEYSYPPRVRAAVLAAMNAQNARVADLARLNFLLGELYADAVLAAQRQFRVKADLVGCHGQTLYHQGEDAELSRTAGRRNLADGRRRGDRRACGCAGGVRFSSGGYGCGRQGSAAGSLSRLFAISRRKDREGRAEHWRDRESYGDSGRRWCERIFLRSTLDREIW